VPDAELAALRSALDAQRRHVLGIVDGLDADGLSRAVLPTGWNCLQLLHHLAVGVERFWFRSVMAGEQLSFPDNDWNVPDGLGAEQVLALYRHEIELADEMLDRTPAGAPPAGWPEWWPDWHYSALREVLLHVITETACHAGHLDATRELIDGRTWLVLD